MTSPKPRSVFSAICRSNGIVLGRTRATVGGRFPQNASRASASPSTGFLPTSAGVISGATSLARVLRQPVEHMRTMLRAAAIFPVNAGTCARDLLNFCRPHVAAGKPSRVAFVNDCRQPANRIARALKLSPIPFVAAAHESNVAKGSCHERQVSCKG